MGKRTKAGIQAVILAGLMGLLAWHTISWHIDGTHKELFDAIGTSTLDTAKAVLYYVGLMATTGMLLGMFSEKITDLFGYEVKKIDHFGDQEEVPTATDLAARREAALEEQAAERAEEQVVEPVR